MQMPLNLRIIMNIADTICAQTECPFCSKTNSCLDMYRFNTNADTDVSCDASDAGVLMFFII